MEILVFLSKFLMHLLHDLGITHLEVILCITHMYSGPVEGLVPDHLADTVTFA